MNIKSISVFLIITLFQVVLLQSNAVGKENQPVLTTNHLDHIGFVVRDIETTLDNWMEILGLETRPAVMIASGDSKNPTHYRGNPSDAKAKLAFLTLDNVRIELIEPIGDGPSHWHEFLKTKGDGVHHFGFNVTQLGETQLDIFKNHDYCLAQNGGWETGEYAYMDTHEALGITIELLEHYNDSKP